MYKTTPTTKNYPSPNISVQRWRDPGLESATIRDGSLRRNCRRRRSSRSEPVLPRLRSQAGLLAGAILGTMILNRQ